LNDACLSTHNSSIYLWKQQQSLLVHLISLFWNLSKNLIRNIDHSAQLSIFDIATTDFLLLAFLPVQFDFKNWCAKIFQKKKFLVKIWNFFGHQLILKSKLTLQLLKGQAFVLICGFLTMLTHVPKLFVTLPLLKKN